MWRALGRTIPRFFTVAGVLLAVALAWLALSADAALAAPPTPTQPTEQTATGQPENRYTRLQRLYRLEQRVLARQEQRLERAGKVAERVEGFIQRQKDKGRDVSKLEDALAKFLAAREQAAGDLATARAILTSHRGFDDEGKVVDAAQARETVREAGKAQHSFRQTMRQAYHQLQIALRQYRHANYRAA